MLFDLRGKRRRVIQVTYAGLAVLLGGGLVGFGIGSGGAGGVLNAFGGGGHGGTTRGGGVDFQERADDFEDRLAGDPNNEGLLIALTKARYQAAISAGDSAGGHGGQTQLTDDSLEQLREATAAWERYLSLKPRRPSVSAASVVAQAYAGLGDPRGAAVAQGILARRMPSQGTLGTLALYRYAAGDLRGGDSAAKRALAVATPAARAQLRQQLSTVRRQARAASAGGHAGAAPPGTP